MSKTGIAKRLVDGIRHAADTVEFALTGKAPSTSVARPSAVSATALSRIGTVNFIREVVKKSPEFRARKIFGIEGSSVYDGIVRTLEDNFLVPEFVVAAAEIPRETLRDESRACEFSGRILALEDGELRDARVDEVRDADVVARPGLGGGANAELLKDLHKQASASFPGKVLVYCPINEGEMQKLRYVRGQRPYIEPGCVLEQEARHFFDHVISPRIMGKAYGRADFPRPVQDCKNLVLFSHSIGAREAGSDMRFLKRRLMSLHLSEESVRDYMSSFLRFNVASPLTGDLTSGSSPSVNVRSVEDAGSKAPEASICETVLNGDFLSRDLTLVTPFENNNSRALAILGPKVITNGSIRGGKFVPNEFGHNLANYVDAMLDEKANPKLHKFLQVYRYFIDPDFTDERFAEQKAEIFKGATRYPFDRSPSEEDVKSLLRVWHSYRLMEELAKQSARSRPMSKSGGDSLCSTEGPDIPLPDLSEVHERMMKEATKDFGGKTSGGKRGGGASSGR